MIETKTANAIRVLSADAIQKAKSGHPGLPLGCASAAYELWANHMRHNPADPQWVDRDRFILSGGHGSMLLYSLFHLFGYGNLSMDDLKNFRQVGSLTPGHPEYGHTVGVEATTGPLGQGMGLSLIHISPAICHDLIIICISPNSRIQLGRLGNSYCYCAFSWVISSAGAYISPFSMVSPA